MANSISLSSVQIDTLRRFSKAAYPNESCAFLLGRQDAEGTVEDIIPMTNADKSPYSFSIPPSELLKAYQEAESRQLHVMGIFHSHPGRPSPSSTDLKFMELNPVVWLIFSSTEEKFDAFIYDEGAKRVELQVRD